MSSTDLVPPDWSSNDNDPQFASQSFYQFYDKYWIQNVDPTANWLAEAFNRQPSSSLKSSFLRADETRMRSSANVLGPTERQSELLQA